MRRLGIENLSTFGMDPAALVRLAAQLGCGHVSLNLGRAANPLDAATAPPLRGDPGLCAAVARELAESRVALSLLEGFALLPQVAPDWDADLDIAARLGARAIGAVSLERDIGRTCDEFARLAEAAAARGLLVATEVGAGVLRTLERCLAALDAVAHPGLVLLIDTMHFFRSGATVEQLAAIDPARIGHVQLCDVPMPALIAEYMEEALYERRCPGDGDLPLGAFMAAIPATVPIGLEVPIRSEACAGVSAQPRLARCVEAARALLCAPR
jgi:sugar phosphate isomerase/epimerase